MQIIMSLIQVLSFFAVLYIAFSQLGDGDGSTSCPDQREKFAYIRCNGDKFSPLQCKNRYCFCVDEDNGVQITFERRFSEGELTVEKCREVAEKCEALTCDSNLNCKIGYKIDDDGCETCECEEEEECEQLTCDVVCENGFKINQDGCEVCECNEDKICQCDEDEECVINNPKWRCQKKLQENDQCKRDNDDDVDADDDDSSDDSNGDDGNEDGTALSITSLSDRFRRLLSSGSIDEEEKEIVSKVRGLNIGAAARHTIGVIQMTTSTCQPGFYCERTDFRNGRCTPVNESGPCYSRRTAAAEKARDCDENGFYRPRVCFKNEDDRIECVCVFPENGTKLEDTRVTLRGDDDDDGLKPVCRDHVYRSCLVTYNRHSYQIKHGQTHFDRCQCRACKCYFGRIYCEPAQTTCRDTCPSEPMNCTLSNGVVIPNGGSVERDCNRCWCRKGHLKCTDIDCDDDDDDDSNSQCRRCRKVAIRKVCGPDGRTYPNRCTALHCFGLSPVDILDGPCARHDPCIRFPCEDGEVCLSRGGVSCLKRYGCSPSDFRVCVNITEVPCNLSISTDNKVINNIDDGEIGSGDVSPTDTAVCGSDGNSYPAICHVIPRRPRIHVLHAGRCDSRSCRGGPVCGIDGITYENICVLRSSSSNARVDYRGRCINDSGTPEQYCEAVLDQGRCSYTSENCNNSIRPLTGCCPICGSVILLVIDLEGLRDAASIINAWRSLDGFAADLLVADFFLALSERCKLEVSLTDSGDLEIVFTTSDDQEYCRSHAEQIVGIINRLLVSQQDGSRERRETDNYDLSSAYQYILGAVSVSSSSEGNSSSSDSTPEPGKASSTALSLFVLMPIVMVILILIN